MSFEAHVPRPDHTVRPPDLPPRVREPLPPYPRAGVGEAAAATGQGHQRATVRRLTELPALLVGALVVAVVIKALLVQAFYIPSESMVPALEIGDRILVEKVTYRLRDPHRGEVVVFEHPQAVGQGGAGAAVRSFLVDLGLLQPLRDTALVKRVIGLPGETITIRQGRVLVDGQALTERTVIPDGRSFPAFTVPDDSYYLLGDNRGNSDDSRYSLGAVPREAVVGRAFVIAWPPGNVSLSLRRHYAGGDHDGRFSPAIAPPALPQPDDAPEAPQP